MKIMQQILKVILVFPLIISSTLLIHHSNNVQAVTLQPDKISGTVLEQCGTNTAGCDDYLELENGLTAVMFGKRLKLYDGSALQWEVYLKDTQPHTKLLYANGYIFVCTQGIIEKFNLNGVKILTKDIGVIGTTNYATKLLEYNDILYFSVFNRDLQTHYISAYDTDLNLLWEKEAKGADKLSISNNKMIYRSVINDNGILVFAITAIDPTTSNTIWQLKHDGEIVAVDQATGDVYLAINDQEEPDYSTTLTKLNNDGIEQWTYTRNTYPETSRDYNQVVPMNDGKIAVFGGINYPNKNREEDTFNTIEILDSNSGTLLANQKINAGWSYDKFLSAFFSKESNSLTVVHVYDMGMLTTNAQRYYHKKLVLYTLNDQAQIQYKIEEPSLVPLKELADGTVIGNRIELSNSYGHPYKFNFFRDVPHYGYTINIPNRSFSDIPYTFWSYDEIQYLSKTKIIRGYPDGKFYADVTVTRAQTAIMLARALKLDTENAPNPNFTDIKEGHYAYKEIAAVAEAGIFQGNNGKFDPESKLTRAQMAVVLTRAYNLTYATETEFTDLQNKGYWAYDAIQALAENRITAGYTDGSFRPEQSLSRAHFAVFMARILDDKFKK